MPGTGDRLAVVSSVLLARFGGLEFMCVECSVSEGVLLEVCLIEMVCALCV